MKKREYGDGRLFRMPRSPYWWMQYYVNGTKIRASTKQTDEHKALMVLRTRVGQKHAGIHPTVDASRYRVRDLATDLLADYLRRALAKGRSGKNRDLSPAWRYHLEPAFGKWKVTQVTTPALLQYQSARQTEGAASSSINNELAYLSRMFNYARKFTGKAKRTPVFPPDLPCAAPRDGFLEDADFYRLVENAEPWFYTLVALGRAYCWRRNELIGMRVGQVDLIHKEIRLRHYTTKSGEPRVVPLTATLTSLMSAAVQGKKKTDYVFTRPDGTPVLDFRDTWQKACCRAGLGELYCRPCLKKLKRDAKPLVAGKCPHCEELPNYHGQSYRGLNFHDLRRTGARNMSELGASESVIMDIAGWKTNHVFKRYRIVPKKDMARAMTAYEEADRAFLARQAEQDLENQDLENGQTKGRLDDKTEHATPETKLN